MVNKQDGFGHEKPGEGQTNDWITPRWVFDALGEFDLDPCESNNQPWTSAKRGYRLCRGEDGLSLPWEGSVYCNPPYGPHTIHWIHKCRDYGNAIMLIFARVETKAWWEIWTGAHGVCFPNKRISFFQPDGKPAKSGTAPSAIIAFGVEALERLRNCTIPGAYILQKWSCYDGSHQEGEADTAGREGMGTRLRVLPESEERPSEGGQISLAGFTEGVSPIETL